MNLDLNVNLNAEALTARAISPHTPRSPLAKLSDEENFLETPFIERHTSPISAGSSSSQVTSSSSRMVAGSGPNAMVAPRRTYSQNMMTKSQSGNRLNGMINNNDNEMKNDDGSNTSNTSSSSSEDEETAIGKKSTNKKKKSETPLFKGYFPLVDEEESPLGDSRFLRCFNMFFYYIIYFPTRCGTIFFLKTFLILILFTIFHHVKLTFFTSFEIKKDLEQDLPDFSTANKQAAFSSNKDSFSVFLVSKNRDQYFSTMKHYLDCLSAIQGFDFKRNPKYNKNIAQDPQNKAFNISAFDIERNLPIEQKPERKVFFYLFDYESDKPLPYPPSLSGSENSKWLKVYENMNVDVKIVRKEPEVEKKDNNAVGQPKKKKKFSIYKTWAFALQNVPTERILYFDNCNYPISCDIFDRYGTDYTPAKFEANPKLKKTNFYFPNVDRFYTQNFATDIYSIRRFLSELPPHLINDGRSFFGGDQLLIWFLNSRRVLPPIGHIDHPTHENTDYVKWNSHSIVMWRIWLYMNKYGTPENNGLGNISPEFCFDKSLLCAFNGLIFKILRLPGLYHIIDASLSLEFAFKLAFLIANTFGATKANWVFGILCSFGALLLTAYILFEILKFLCWVVFCKVIFCDFKFDAESSKTKSGSKKNQKIGKRKRKTGTDFKRLKNIISSPTATSGTLLPQFQTKSLKELDNFL